MVILPSLFRFKLKISAFSNHEYVWLSSIHTCGLYDCCLYITLKSYTLIR